MKENDAALLQQIARRNWIVLGFLLTLSLLVRSTEFTLGVLAGGLVAIIAYHWLYRSATKALIHAQNDAARKFKFSYFIRLGTLGVALYVLIALARLDPVGLAVGLSVVVLNMFWTTLRRVL